MANLNRYVWVYLSRDKKRNIWEWSTWFSPDEKPIADGIPTPHKQTFGRNGIRYHVHSEHPLPVADALQIVRSLYEYEFSAARI